MDGFRALHCTQNSTLGAWKFKEWIDGGLLVDVVIGQYLQRCPNIIQFPEHLNTKGDHSQQCRGGPRSWWWCGIKENCRWIIIPNTMFRISLQTNKKMSEISILHVLLLTSRHGFIGLLVRIPSSNNSHSNNKRRGYYAHDKTIRGR